MKKRNNGVTQVETVPTAANSVKPGLAAATKITLVTAPVQSQATGSGENGEISPVQAVLRDNAPQQEAPSFRIVGLGASAGGLEALTQLLQHLPADTGMAFILVQHLSPDRESALVQLLARATPMPVEQASDGQIVKPNCVYVIPPDRHLAIQDGVLHVTPHTRMRGANLAVDFFFRSLAEDKGADAIGVVLSGTGTDGMLGLQTIKAEGGITFSQDETSAKFTGMPHSAISAGHADFVLPPEQIAQELVRIAAGGAPSESSAALTDVASLPNNNALAQIFEMLVHRCNVDFNHYKHSTIQRRIARRMLLHRMVDMDDYADLLKSNTAEVDALYQDILINVTRFFREEEAFESLKTFVFPAILKDRQPNSPIRLWVPGCSTGEEVYSLLICLLEYLSESGDTYPIQVFASDIDELALNVARSGVYSPTISADVSESRLIRFFVRTSSGYQIAKSVRDLCIFAKQNLVKDPPFSNLDLISCRNVLIYLDAVFQKRALSFFHYALKPSGFLFLGTAEGVGGFADLFQLVENRARIHAKKTISNPPRLDFGHPNQFMQVKEAGHVKSQRMRKEGLVVQQEVDRLLAVKYSPPAVVINDQLQILYFRGQTATYLQPAQGEATLNLLKMARGNLMLELRLVVMRAITERAAVRREGVQFRDETVLRQLNIDVTPVESAGLASACFLVTFEEIYQLASAEPPSQPDESSETNDRRLVNELSQELIATKEYLQSAIAQHEAVSADLNSATEELQSSNEELQSINEELESAKEELQSTNEELATVNDELEHRNTDLTQLNNDLSNLIDSTYMPTIMVGLDLRIRRFTSPAKKLFNLIDGDIGRPLSDIATNFESVNLVDVIRDVIATAGRRELEAQANNDCWYSIRTNPYKTIDGAIDGAVLTLIDIHEIKQNFEQAKDARDFAEAVIATAPHPVLVLDKDLRVTSVSTAYLQFFAVSGKETVGNLLYHLGNGQWAIPKLRAALEAVLQDKQEFDHFIVEHLFEHVGKMRVEICGRYIKAGITRPPLIYMQIQSA